MARLDFDYDGLEKVIIPSIEKTIQELNTIEFNQNFQVNEFSSRLDSLKQQINDLNIHLVDIKEWLKDDIILLKNVSERLDIDANKLNVLEFPTKQ